MTASEVVVVLGENGPGKTTLFRVIAGRLAAQSTHILLRSEAIGGRAVEAVVRAGIGNVLRGPELSPRLTIGDDLDLAGRFCPQAWHEALKQHVFSPFPARADRMTRRAGSLSGGQQPMLAIARAGDGSEGVAAG